MKTAVIFDFDYTLADSSKGAHECINYALKHMGRSPCDFPQCCRTIGLSLPETYRTLTGDNNAANESEFHRLEIFGLRDRPPRASIFHLFQKVFRVWFYPTEGFDIGSRVRVVTIPLQVELGNLRDPGGIDDLQYVGRFRIRLRVGIRGGLRQSVFG